jgi:hypothetical protein
MKIYITNILPQSITNNKINKLSSIIGKPETKYRNEIFSEDFGIYTIEENLITQIESTFNPNYELIKNYNTYDLLVDKTIYNKKPIVSQFPVNYLNTNILELKFKYPTKSKLSLIIECFEEIDNYERIIVPINFYFNYDEENLDLKDKFFQEDFNMFLSHLN